MLTPLVLADAYASPPSSSRPPLSSPPFLLPGSRTLAAMEALLATRRNLAAAPPRGS